MDLINTPKVEKVMMLDRYNSKNPSMGTLFLTATHLIYVDSDSNKETWILHMHIASIDKLPLSTKGSPMIIRCKTFLSVTFVVPKERECHDIYITLLKLSQPTQIKDLYCFQYTSSNEDLPKHLGWNFFDLENEFKRMRVPNSDWTKCTLNESYQLCDTYPSTIFVPAEVTTAILISSSKFRSKGRLPALTYLHPNRASISRCSQPLSGFSARCLEDEQMLEAIRKTNPNSSFMYVVDTRPKINAMANRATGKGYENEAFYENIKFKFFGIENIHVMRVSLQKLMETCEQKSPTMNSFLTSLESSGWLKHIRAILETSCFIADAIDSGISVVVHCSDGWDRTAQVCSLATLTLDPYFRTIKGFQALIEKDWLAFGHKFNDRCGHIQTSDGKEVSPVFTQFLDCTWQLMEQRQDAFEFNERFLLILHDHVQSCQFGTFIGNNEKERKMLGLSETTFSLWGFMSNHLHEYINPLYRPEMDEIVKPNLSPQLIKYWRGMYSRFESGVHPRESIADILLAKRDHITSLEDHVQHLTNKITHFKSMISKRLQQNPMKSSVTQVPPPKEIEKTDNRYNYDKRPTEMSCANNDHPLQSTNFSFSNLSMGESNHELDKLNAEIDSVALDWKSFRNVKTCQCGMPFDDNTKKNHCWSCGSVFCTRCIYKKSIALAGHESGKPVPVCDQCFKKAQTTSP